MLLFHSSLCHSAYANNQHRLDQEISGGRLDETSFAKALRLAKGTVSIVDSEGVSFSAPPSRLPRGLPCLNAMSLLAEKLDSYLVVSSSLALLHHYTAPCPCTGL